MRPVAPPRWTRVLLTRAADPDRVDEVLGDLDEAHRLRVERHGRIRAALFTTFEAIDMAWALRVHRGRLARRFRGRVPPDLRTARRRRMPPISWLDFELGLRMMNRYPGMTIVGGAAMALGIAIGAGTLHLMSELVFPDRPYADADRIVGIRLFDASLGSRTSGDVIHHLQLWREGLRTIDHVGAMRTSTPNVAVAGGMPEPMRVLALSASTFELAPVPPTLGRTLLPEDEPPSAPSVAVISHDLWRTRFDEDPGVLGRVITVDREPTTVVGVMPPRFNLHVPSEDFVYPFVQDLWVPFRLNPLDFPLGAGPVMEVVGRLAPGATPREAQDEIDALQQAAADDAPELHGDVRPRVLTFSNPLGVEHVMNVRRVLSLGAFFVSMVMIALCANVALLMYARAASREGEMAVRSALGASRARIVGQLFVEALALASVAIAVGLFGATWGVRWVYRVIERVSATVGWEWPPVDLSLSPSTIGIAGGLGLLGAVVAGILPGLKVARRRDAIGLQRYAGRSTSLGRTCSGILTMQVSLTTMLIPIAVMFAVQAHTLRHTEWGFPAEEYLTAQLFFDYADMRPETDDFQGRYEQGYEALRERLTTDPAVRGVTIADAFPGFYHSTRTVEVENGGVAPPGRWAHVAWADPNFFDVLGAEIIAGRGFGTIDVEGDARTVVVNESFVREWLGGGNAVGRRIRYVSSAADVDDAGDEEPWLEIVGVVRELATNTGPATTHNRGIYEPLRAGETYPIRIALHVPSGPEAFIGSLRRAALDVAPELQVSQPIRLSDATAGEELAYDTWFRLLSFVGVFAILLTQAGIYAIVSFTVARRTREIGVRVALGANHGRIASAILSRMTRLVTIGVVMGLPLPLWMFMEGNLDRGVAAWLVAFYCAGMIPICMGACVVPLRRALSIQPTEALAAEG